MLNNLTNVNGTLFFTADDGTHGSELWKSDGSSAGTMLVKDINTGSLNSYPRVLTNVNGTLFYQRRRRHARTRVMEERRHGSGNSAGERYQSRELPASNPSNLTNVNGTLFFTANDGTHGGECGRATAPPREL